MEEKGFIAIIILNYNNYFDTINCIESIERINTAKIKYIVIDNGSPKSDEVPQLNNYLSNTFKGKYLLLSDNDKVPDKLPYCTFLASDNNSGYACGNKKGINIAYQDDDIDTILILNNDVLFVDDFISPIYQTLWSSDNYMLAAPLIMKADGISIDRNCARRKKTFTYLVLWFIFVFKDVFGILKRMNKRLYMINDKTDLSQNFIVDMPSGSCFMVKKEDFKEIDDFDPNTFLYYEEDILSEKISKYKKQCILIPKYRCLHLGASTTKKSPSGFAFKKGVESALYYVKNYLQVGSFRYKFFFVITRISIFIMNLKKIAKGKLL